MARWPSQNTGTWTGLPSLRVRVVPSLSQAVQEAAGPGGPHHFLGTSASVIGRGTPTSPEGHGALHLPPSNDANGTRRPSRRSTPRLNLGPAGAAASTAVIAHTVSSATKAALAVRLRKDDHMRTRLGVTSAKVIRPILAGSGYLSNTSRTFFRRSSRENGLARKSVARSASRTPG